MGMVCRYITARETTMAFLLSTRASGPTTDVMATALHCTLMAHPTKANSKTTSKMDKASISGYKDMSIKVHSETE
jgi:hypothetical protein